jgi:hypothetical protein
MPGVNSCESIKSNSFKSLGQMACNRDELSADIKVKSLKQGRGTHRTYTRHTELLWQWTFHTGTCVRIVRATAWHECVIHRLRDASVCNGTTPQPRYFSFIVTSFRSLSLIHALGALKFTIVGLNQNHKYSNLSVIVLANPYHTQHQLYMKIVLQISTYAFQFIIISWINALYDDRWSYRTCFWFFNIPTLSLSASG